MGGSDNVVVPLENIERYLNEKERVSYRVRGTKQKIKAQVERERQSR
jgi:hypothetical protein